MDTHWYMPCQNSRRTASSSLLCVSAAVLKADRELVLKAVRQDGRALHAVDRQRTAWARRTIDNGVFEVVADNSDTHLRVKVRPAIGRPLRWRSSP
jgi:hypothetical protein